jgi:hypothetical protein
VQLYDLLDKEAQPLAIKFGRGIVEEQRRCGVRERLQQAQLRDGHGHGNQLLLAAGENLPGGPAAEAHGNIRPMRS